MAVVSVRESGMNWGQTSLNGADVATVEYLIKTDSPLTGPTDIRKHMDFPKLGDPYDFGSDSDPQVFARGFRIEKHKPLATLSWRGTVTYYPVGEPSPDPETWDDKIWMTNRLVATGIVQAKNLSEHEVRHWQTNALIRTTRATGTKGPLTNSAGSLVMPQPNYEASYWVLVIEKIMKTFDQSFFEGYENTRNVTDLRIARNGFLGNWLPDNVRCVAITGSRSYYPGAIADIDPVISKWRWLVRHEFWIRERDVWPDGWNISQIDIGLERAAYEGAKNSYGSGVISDYDALFSGGPGRISIMDPLTGQKMNGNTLLKDGNINTGDPVYLPYEIIEAKNHNDLGIFD